VLLKCEFEALECPLVFIISTSLYSAFEYNWMRFPRLMRNVFHYVFLCQYTGTGHVQDEKYKHREVFSVRVMGESQNC